MAKNSAKDIEVKAFATHHVITQPNPLRKVLRRVEEKDMDDPIARAEQALAGLSGEFKGWMTAEVNRLSSAYVAIRNDGFTKERATSCSAPRTTSRATPPRLVFRLRPQLPRACAASSSTRRISKGCRPSCSRTTSTRSSPSCTRTPSSTASASPPSSAAVCARSPTTISPHVNRDRPEHLEVILAPSIVPAE